MHVLLNELVASRVHLAALDNNLQNALSPIVQKLYALDVGVGLAKAVYLESKDLGLENLSKLHKRANELDDELLITVTDMVSLKD